MIDKALTLVYDIDALWMSNCLPIKLTNELGIVLNKSLHLDKKKTNENMRFL